MSPINKHILIVFTYLILLLCVIGNAISQTNFYVPLRVTGSDTSNIAGNLIFGVHPGATYCVDDTTLIFFDSTSILECELPPKPPSDVFDVRFIDNRTGAGKCMGEGVNWDIRGFLSPTQIDTHRINLQIGGATPPYIVSWPAGLSQICDSIKIGQTISTSIRMDLNPWTTFIEEVVSIRIWKFGSKSYPTTPPVAPKLFSPDSGGVDIVAKPVTFIWSGSLGASEYYIEVATDNNFTTIVYRDTTRFERTDFGIVLKKNLSYQTTYYWRVRAKNKYGIGPYSNVFKFITEIATISPPSQPRLLFPDSAAGNIIKTPQLKWSRSETANKYHLQVSTDINFIPSALVVNDSTIIDTVKQIGPLNGGLKYYWRVRGINEGGNGAFSTIFFFTTILNPPPAPILVYPANNDTAISINPILRWRKSEDAANYHLQVSTDIDFNVIVFNDSTLLDTSKQVNLNNSTIYFWKVKAKNAAGVSLFSSHWQFKTIIQTPGQPILLSPINGATDVSLTPMLIWNKVQFAASYRLQVSLDQNFSTFILNDPTITDTSFTLPTLLSNKRYYWRVNATNYGGTSSFSSTFFFNTIVLPPLTPVLLFPNNNDTSVIVNPVMRWRSSNDASNYHLQIATDVDFNNLIFNDSTLVDTIKQVTLNNYINYYWRVRAKNTAGVSAFTTTWQFKTIIQIPTQPTLLLPANGDTNVALIPTLIWRKVEFTSKYGLQLSFDPTFQVIVYSNSNITDTSHMPPELETNRWYYWRVNATNYAGTSPYSSVSSFKTLLLPPDIVILASPEDSSINIIQTPTLSWNAAARATKYHLQVDTNAAFSNPIVDNSNITNLSINIGPLQSGVRYYWRVRGWNTSGFSNFSATWNFTTIAVPVPAQTVLNSPPNNSRNISLTPILSWLETPYTEKYLLEIALDTFFTNRIFIDSNITSNSREVGPLSMSKKYFWHVRAKNTAGIGQFSDTWSFSTIGDEPALWLTPFVVLETGIARDTIRFGVHPNATHGIDPTLGEYELPPVQPGIFDLRWVSSPRRPGTLGEGTRINYLPFINFTQVDTYKVQFLPGTGTYPMYLSWSHLFIRSICDSMLLKDEFGGTTANVRMDVYPSTIISNSSLSSLLIIKWGTRPLNIKIESNQIPSEFVLYPNYPNPFNPSTKLKFAIKNTSQVILNIYNMLGEKVTTLINGYFYPGEYSIDWDGKDHLSKIVPSGIYFAHLVVNDENISKNIVFSAIQKMILLK